MKRSAKVFRFLCLYLSVAVILSGCRKDFDAAGYVQALLDLTFQGDVSQAAGFMEEASRESLMQAYQDSIDRFVAANITSGMEIGELKTTRFADLVSRIFMTMRYGVGEAEKTGKEEYEVSVDIWPADVFIRFNQMLIEDSLKMAEKIEAGEYKGATEEETDQMIFNDIVNHAYELLDAAGMDMDFGKKETVILRVSVGDGQEYSVNEDDMDGLIRKILRLDEIQG